MDSPGNPRPELPDPDEQPERPRPKTRPDPVPRPAGPRPGRPVDRRDHPPAGRLDPRRDRVAIWVVAVFARQVVDVAAASDRADRLRIDNASLASQVDDLERELDLVQRQAFVQQEARAQGLGTRGERPFTLGPDASPLAGRRARLGRRPARRPAVADARRSTSGSSCCSARAADRRRGRVGGVPVRRTASAQLRATTTRERDGQPAEHRGLEVGDPVAFGRARRLRTGSSQRSRRVPGLPASDPDPEQDHEGEADEDDPEEPFAGARQPARPGPQPGEPVERARQERRRRGSRPRPRPLVSPSRRSRSPWSSGRVERGAADGDRRGDEADPAPGGEDARPAGDATRPGSARSPGRGRSASGTAGRRACRARGGAG